MDCEGKLHRPFGIFSLWANMGIENLFRPLSFYPFGGSEVHIHCMFVVRSNGAQFTPLCLNQVIQNSASLSKANVFALLLAIFVPVRYR